MSSTRPSRPHPPLPQPFLTAAQLPGSAVVAPLPGRPTRPNRSLPTVSSWTRLLTSDVSRAKVKAMRPFSIIGFDADDTLWHNERLYVRAQTQLKTLLSGYVADEQMDERLYQTEMRNLAHFGYGIKAFTLSMIETAIELTNGGISARDIQAIIHNARDMMVADVELLDHVDEALGLLAADHTLMLITKGDLLDQERKVARSGLAQHFRYVEIVSDKARENYDAILQRLSIPASDFWMVGNSLRSDILPVLELGGTAVYVQQELTWVHESADPPPSSQSGFHQIEHLGQLPALVVRLEEQRAAAP